MSASSLQFLGTGTAFHADGRGSQCVLIRPAAGAPYLVDIGPTAMAAMMRAGSVSDELERLFVTHLHGDHVAGWPFLILQLQFADRRTRPFEVYGPSGTRECLEGLMSLCYADVLEGTGLGFEIRYHELEVAMDRDRSAGEVHFDVVPVDHHPSSVGYCFDVAGTRVAVTGDTRWCDGLEALARRSDLLILECTSLRKTAQAHVSLDEIRSRLDRLGNCRIVLIHLPDEVAEALEREPIARVSASHDGMILRL